MKMRLMSWVILAGKINLITEKLHLAVLEAQEADRVRRELVVNISHDLNTPLTSALGYVRRVSEQGGERLNDQDAYFLKSALLNLDVLSKLLADLFEFTKLDAKDLEPVWESFSLLDLLTEEVLPVFSGPAAERGILLRAEHPEKVPYAYGDGDLIGRVLANLTENAIRYSQVRG